MVMSSRVHSSFFSAAFVAPQHPMQAPKLIRLPLSVAPQYETRCEVTGAIIPTHYKPLFRSNLWSTDEHERFLRGLELFPNGPWKEVANVVGTKTTRQTMTHAQKYRQKIERRLQGNSTTRRGAKSRAVKPSRPFREVLYSTLQDTSVPAAVDQNQSCNVIGGSTSDVFDCTLLDKEFQELVSSLQPLPCTLGSASQRGVSQWK